MSKRDFNKVVFQYPDGMRRFASMRTVPAWPDNIWLEDPKGSKVKSYKVAGRAFRVEGVDDERMRAETQCIIILEEIPEEGR